MSKDYIYTCEKCGGEVKGLSRVIFRDGIRAISADHVCKNPKCMYVNMIGVEVKPLKDFNLSISELATEIINGVYGQGTEWREAIKPLELGELDMDELYAEINKQLGFEVF